MNRFLPAALAALLLGGCAANQGADNAFGGLGSGIGIGGNIVKTAMTQQCRTELDKNKQWKLMGLVMGAEQQSEWGERICGCATEEAANHLTSTEMMQILSPSTRAQAVSSIAGKAITACFKRLYPIT